MDVVVELQSGECSGVKSYGVNLIIFSHNGKNSSESVDGDQREFDLETRVTTNRNLIIPEMFYSCALNK